MYRLKNNRGFSLIETLAVIVIISLLAVMLVGSVMSFADSASARAARAADALLSRCKVDSLSGMDCRLVIYYDSSAGEYVCALYKEGVDVPYESAGLGGGRLNISVFAGQYTAQAHENPITVVFSPSTGAVERLFFGGALITDWREAKIVFDSGPEYDITLFRLTGGHELSR